MDSITQSQTQKSWTLPLSRCGLVHRDELSHFQRAGIHTLGRLFCHLPDRYIDPAWAQRLPGAGSQESALPLSPGSIYLLKLIHVVPSYDHRSSKRWLTLTFGVGRRGSQLTLYRSRRSGDDDRQSELDCRIGHWFVIELGAASGKQLTFDPLLIPLGTQYPWPVDHRQSLHYPSIAGVAQKRVRYVMHRAIERYALSLKGLATNPAGQPLSPVETMFALHSRWRLADVAQLNQHDSQYHNAMQYFRPLLLAAANP